MLSHLMSLGFLWISCSCRSKYISTSLLFIFGHSLTKMCAQMYCCFRASTQRCSFWLAFPSVNNSQENCTFPDITSSIPHAVGTAVLREQQRVLGSHPDGLSTPNFSHWKWDDVSLYLDKDQQHQKELISS